MGKQKKKEQIEKESKNQLSDKICYSNKYTKIKSNEITLCMTARP
jgi:hypothetical protein